MIQVNRFKMAIILILIQFFGVQFFGEHFLEKGSMVNPIGLSALAQSIKTEDKSIFQKGIDAYAQHRYISALSLFKKASALDPTNMTVRYYQANTLVQLNREETAFKLYQWINQQAPTSRAAQLSRIALTRLKHLGYTGERKRGQYIVSTAHTEAKANKKAENLKPDYLDYLSEPGIRWDASAMPLKIYVPKQDSRRATVHYEDLVPKALNEWAKSANGHISFQMVHSPDQADIRIVWLEMFGKREEILEATRGGTHEIGMTYLEWDLMTKKIRPHRIEFSVRDFGSNKPYSKQAMLTTMVHEFGHALGMSGHSDYTKDVMAPVAHTRTTLSHRDKASILRKYQDF